MYDFTLLTDARYLRPKPESEYVSNIFEEDRLLTEALQSLGFTVHRTNWDDPSMDWSQTRFAVFRTTWDYFERIEEFRIWLEKVKETTRFVNVPEILLWNLDKHYLQDLHKKGIAIPPTQFIKTGDGHNLRELCQRTGWREFILKPTISGAARHTYRFTSEGIGMLEPVFQELIRKEDLLLQEYLNSITHQGEISLMVFGGTYSHAVLKKAKQGDFRVQDDFGGTVHSYHPSLKEIALAEAAVSFCQPQPVYARVDLVWDNDGGLCVSELELIEPELWMRRHPESAVLFAEGLAAFAGRKV